jgi:glycerate dehydrogenase
MAIKIVVVDRACLPEGTEYRSLDIESFGWEEYGVLAGSELAERCRRADILVTHHTPLPAVLLDACPKLGLVVLAGGEPALVDTSALAAHGIALCTVPGTWTERAAAESLCASVCASIEDYLRARSANSTTGNS